LVGKPFTYFSLETFSFYSLPCHKLFIPLAEPGGLFDIQRSTGSVWVTLPVLLFIHFATGAPVQ